MLGSCAETFVIYDLLELWRKFRYFRTYYWGGWIMEVSSLVLDCSFHILHRREICNNNRLSCRELISNNNLWCFTVSSCHLLLLRFYFRSNNIKFEITYALLHYIATNGYLEMETTLIRWIPAMELKMNLVPSVLFLYIRKRVRNIWTKIE